MCTLEGKVHVNPCGSMVLETDYHKNVHNSLAVIDYQRVQTSVSDINVIIKQHL